MDDLKKLLRERDHLDSKIALEESILKQNRSTMDSPLVDSEGFPIPSIDVYAVRTSRVQLIRLANDRKALQAKIAESLEAAHADERLRKEAGASELETQKEDFEIVHRTSNDPFARVINVLPGGPADEDGLKEDDYILQWGPIHRAIFTGIVGMAEEAKNAEGKVLRVTALRNGRAVRLEIRPRKWKGSGLLGCGLEKATEYK